MSLLKRDAFAFWQGEYKVTGPGWRVPPSTERALKASKMPFFKTPALALYHLTVCFLVEFSPSVHWYVFAKLSMKNFSEVSCSSTRLWHCSSLETKIFDYLECLILKSSWNSEFLFLILTWNFYDNQYEIRILVEKS